MLLAPATAAGACPARRAAAIRSAAARFGAVSVTKVRFSGSDRASRRKLNRSWMRASVMGAEAAARSSNSTTEAVRASGRRSWVAFWFMKVVSWASVGAGAVPAMAWVTVNQRPSRVSSA